jgi:hypothetical protein
MRTFVATTKAGHKLEFEVTSEGSSECNHKRVSSQDMLTGRIEGWCEWCNYRHVGWTERDHLPQPDDK